MTTILPLDSNSNPIPALRFKQNAAHSISVSSVSARNTTAFESSTKIISLYTTAPVYIAFGNSSVTADSGDHYFPAGLYYDICIGGDSTGHYTHLAAIRVSDNGILYISEKE